MDDICIIYDKDSRNWKDYMVESFKNQVDSCRIKSLHSTELVLTARNGLLKSIRAQIYIVVLTPDLINTLANNSVARYSTFVLPGCGVILQCGSETVELEVAGLTERFGDITSWLVFEHDEVQKLIAVVVDQLKKQIRPIRVTLSEPDLVQRSNVDTGKLTSHCKVIPEGNINNVANKTGTAPSKAISPGDPIAKPPKNPLNAVKVVPSTAMCEGDTIVAVSFYEPLVETSQVRVILVDDTNKDHNDSFSTEIKLDRLNPHTYTFTAPEHQPGYVDMKIIVDDYTCTTKRLHYETPLSSVADLSLIYIHQISSLIQSLSSQGNLSHEQVDEKLCRFFQAELPAAAFESLFRVYQHSPSEKSSVELPTLIHLSARYGLQELSSKLVDLPDAIYAYKVQNCKGQLPEHLAREHGHIQLAKFLESTRQADDEFSEMYIEICGYAGPRYINNDAERAKEWKNVVPWHNCRPGYISMQKGTSIRAPVRLPDRATGPQQPPAGSRSPGTVPSSLSVTAPSSLSTVASDKSAYNGMSESNRRLVDIMERVKSNKLTVAQAEEHYKQWMRDYKNVQPKSFTEHQEKLQRIREEMSLVRTAKGKTGQKLNFYSPS